MLWGIIFLFIEYIIILCILILLFIQFYDSSELFRLIVEVFLEGIHLFIKFFINPVLIAINGIISFFKSILLDAEKLVLFIKNKIEKF